MAEPSPAEALAAAVERPVVVLCVGNATRGDDGFGPAVAARLGERPDVIDAGTAPENELPRAARMRPRTIVLVDAVHFAGRDGEVRVIAATDLRFDDFSTHAASLALCAQFLREACGARTVLLAAQPVATGLGDTMSSAMRVAVAEAAALLETLLV